MPIMTVTIEIDMDLYQRFLRYCSEYGNNPNDVLVEAVRHIVEVEQQREDTDYWQTVAKTRSRY